MRLDEDALDGVLQRRRLALATPLPMPARAVPVPRKPLPWGAIGVVLAAGLVLLLVTGLGSALLANQFSKVEPAPDLGAALGQGSVAAAEAPPNSVDPVDAPLAVAAVEGKPSADAPDDDAVADVEISAKSTPPSAPTSPPEIAIAFDLNGWIAPDVQVPQSLRGCRTIRVSGHTCTLGDPDVNALIAQARAETVAARLVAAGIPESSIDIVAVGAVDPIASNATAAGRARNRRVEVRCQESP